MSLEDMKKIFNNVFTWDRHTKAYKIGGRKMGKESFKQFKDIAFGLNELMQARLAMATEIELATNVLKFDLNNWDSMTPERKNATFADFSEKLDIALLTQKKNIAERDDISVKMKGMVDSMKRQQEIIIASID